MTVEEKNAKMNDLIFKGYLEKTGKIVNFEYTIKTLRSDVQLELEKEMKFVSGTPNFVWHTWQLKVLDQTLTKFGDTIFNTPDEVKAWRATQSSVVLDALLTAQNALEREAYNLVGLSSKEDVENFTEPPEQEKD